MKLLRPMLKEEWRLQSQLFGGWGFGAFPIVVGVICFAAYFGVLASGFTFAELERGVAYVVFFLGLSVGSVGFVSRDAVENLLGETNLLVFTSRTLPVSQRRAVSVFVVKDLIYYSFLYLTPLVVALLPAAVVVDASPRLGVVWLAVNASFTLGVASSFFLAALSTRGRPYLFGFAAVLGVAILFLRGEVLSYTPLALYDAPSPTTFAVAYVPAVVIGVTGIYFFDPEGGSEAQTYRDVYPRLRNILRRDPLAAKMVLDVTRSSGGIWKTFFSVGILFAVFVFLVLYVDIVSAIVAAPGLAFAVLLALSSVSVYHWINRFDRFEQYANLPVDADEVLRAKLVTFLVISLPVSYIYLVVGGVIFGFDEMLVGAVVLPLFTVYVFGVTSYLTGFEPNELLLDSVLFSIFTVAVAAIAVPLFVGAIAYLRFPTVAVVFSVGLSAVSAVVGYLLYRRGPRRV